LSPASDDSLFNLIALEDEERIIDFIARSEIQDEAAVSVHGEHGERLHETTGVRCRTASRNACPGGVDTDLHEPMTSSYSAA
jgi:hypothetical protein